MKNGTQARSPGRGFTLIELMIAVTIIGLLAAVAIPAFRKYVRRSYTVEALMSLEKMATGSSAYYMSEHADSAGAVLAPQFPFCAAGWAVMPPTWWRCPNLGGSGGALAKMDPGWWRASIGAPGTPQSDCFSAMSFGIDDPFNYSVGAATSTQHPGATTAGDQINLVAQADMDCNSIQAIFQRLLVVSSDLSVRKNPVYMVTPLE